MERARAQGLSPVAGGRSRDLLLEPLADGAASADQRSPGTEHRLGPALHLSARLRWAGPARLLPASAASAEDAEPLAAGDRELTDRKYGLSVRGRGPDRGGASGPDGPAGDRLPSGRR